MSVYSTNLFTGLAPTSTSTVYTTPAGYTTIVRDIEVYNQSVNSYSIYFYTNVSGSNLVFAGDTGLAADGFYQWKGRVVLPATFSLLIFGGGATIHVTMSGYQLYG